MEEKKDKEKIDFYLVESDQSDTGKRKGKKVLKHQTMLLSCPPWNLHLFHYFLFYIIIYTIFTIYDTFHIILSLNDTRDTTNFTTYVLKIGMSPITKNNFKYLFIIFFK